MISLVHICIVFQEIRCQILDDVRRSDVKVVSVQIQNSTLNESAKFFPNKMNIK